MALIEGRDPPGHPPFAGESMAHLVAAHLNTPPPRRTYKRDRKGRFAPTGSSRVKRARRKINRRRPRYVRGSLGKTVRVGRVGPGGEYAGVHVGAKLRTRKRAEYCVGVSAGKVSPRRTDRQGGCCQRVMARRDAQPLRHQRCD